MKHIPLTQSKFALVDDADYERLSAWKWSARADRGTWYAVRTRNKDEGPGPGMIYMHREILGTPDGMQTDHVDGDGLNNQRENLRLATATLNHRNHHRRKPTRRGLPMGVSRDVDCRSRPYYAQIATNGKRRHLGYFATPNEAHAAYLVAREKNIAVAEREILQGAES